MATFEISLAGEDLDAHDQQTRVKQLAREIEARTEARTALSRSDGDGTTKGDPLTIGALVMTFMTSGVAVAALGVLKAWIERGRVSSATIKGPDGTEVTITNTNADQIEAMVKTLALPES